MAFAAGTVADTIKIQQRIRSVHPAKNQTVFPNIFHTQAKEVPAFGSSLLSLINARAIQNIISPERRMLAGASIPVIPIIVKAVASIE